MRHAGKRTVGTVAIGLLVAMLVASVFGASVLAAAPHAGASSNAAASRTTNLAPAGHLASAAVHPAATTASIVALNSLATYQLIPFTLQLQITVAGSSINISTTSVYVTLRDDVVHTFCGAVSANNSVLPGKTVYNLSIDALALTPALSKCPGIAIHGTDVKGFVLVNDTAYGGTTALNNTATQVTNFIFAPLTAAIVAPTGAVGAGNVSVMALYTAQYVSSVTLVIWSPGKASVVFNSSLAWAGPTDPNIGTWFVPNAGVYPYALTVSTAYQNLTVAGNFTVLPGAGSPVYQNSSNWQNSSVFPGVSGAVAGTILLVVGLIIGMIVALAIGRSLMRPASAAPAQPWQPSAAGANQCSVCGKSFATPDELKDHAKSEHGMT
jgi:hypothetical protein